MTYRNASREEENWSSHDHGNVLRKVGEVQTSEVWFRRYACSPQYFFPYRERSNDSCLNLTPVIKLLEWRVKIPESAKMYTRGRSSNNCSGAITAECQWVFGGNAQRFGRQRQLSKLRVKDGGCNAVRSSISQTTIYALYISSYASWFLPPSCR